MPSQQLVETHRRDLAVLIALLLRDLRALFADLAGGGADEVRDGLIEGLPALVGLYGSAAATLAADWYDEARDVAGVRGRFRAVPAELPDRGRTDSLAGWGVSPLYQAEPDPVTAESKVGGGLQRIVANASRETITGSSVADPKARGWQRVGVGGCDFCRMLLGRGAVYTEATADFESHDHCRCCAAPAFD